MNRYESQLLLKKINKVVFFVIYSLIFSGCFLNLKVSDLNNSTNTSSIESNVSSLPNPENINIDTILAKQVSIKWSGVSSATKYRIIISESAIPSEHCEQSSLQSTGTSVTLDSLSADTNYYYRICSDNDSITSTGASGSFKTLKYAQRNSAYSNYKNWNDYLLNDGLKYFSASQTVCPGGMTGGFNSCINGGLVQKLVLPDVVPCDRIKIQDSLEAFRWICDDSTSATIIFSTDFNPRKGLKDLIDGYSFKKNYLMVKVDGVNTYSSDVESWWQNPIEELPDSALGSTIGLTNSGSTAGKIFVVSTSKTADSYIFNDSKISIVILKDKILKRNSASVVANFINFNGQLHSWFEGDIDGSSTNGVLLSVFAFFSRVHNFHLFNYSNIGVQSGSGYNCVFSDFNIRNGRIGFSYTQVGSLIKNGIISGMTDHPLAYITSTTVTNVLISNNSDVTSSAIAYPDESIFTNITMANNQTRYGMRLFGANDNLFHNFLISNSGSTSIYSWQGNHNTFSQFLSAGSTSNEIQISTTQNEANKFTNNLVLDNLSECAITNDTAYSSGLAVGTCQSDGPYSNVNLRIVPIDQSKLFVGKVNTTDLTNLTNSFGTSLFASILDWFNFDNYFRVWGNDGSAYPNSDNRSKCISGTCRIWDYRLLNDNGNYAFNSTGTVIAKNDIFSPAMTCPSAVDGNVYTTYDNTQTATTYTFLTNAVEIMGDGAGNDNTLCESGESCLYTPNFGAYQGEGDYLSQGSCVFQNGTITNVKLYAYPVIGI